MKNSKIRLVIALITVTAIIFGCCGVNMFAFAETTPNPVVVNDGTHGTTGTTNYLSRTVGYEGVLDGKSLKFTATSAQHGSIAVGLPLNTSGVTDLSKVEAITFQMKVDDLGSKNVIASFSANRQEHEFINNETYFVTTDGQLQHPANRTFNAVEGTYIIILPDSDKQAINAPWGQKGADGDGKWTWAEYMTEYGLSALTMYFDPSASIKDSSIYFDNFTLHYDKEQVLSDYKCNVNPPASELAGGIVAKNQQITLTADSGAEIYYTLDGTTPDKTSTKYDAANPPVISQPLTLKAVAYLDGESSLVTSYTYSFLDDTVPNTHMLNDGSNTSDFAVNGNITAVADNDISPYAPAALMTGVASDKSAVILGLEMNQINTDILAVKQGIAFWAKLEAGMEISPCFNGEKYGYNGQLIAYNTTTGETKTFDTSTSFKFTEAFEGWLVLKLEGDCVKQKWGDTLENVDGYWTWREWVAQKGLTQMQFYVIKSQYNNKSWIYDDFMAVTDIDKFLTEKKSEGLRPMMPYTDVVSGTVAKNQEVNLYSNADADIYYTLDGTAPTVNSAKFDPENPITVTGAVTVKAMAERNGLKSATATFTYNLLDSSFPNTVILNDGTKAEDFDASSGDIEIIVSEIVSNVSPDGDAAKMTDTLSSGAVMLGIPMHNVDANTIAAQQALAFWVRIPSGMNASLNPCIDNQRYPFRGTITTYNTATGEMIETKDTTSITISGAFEGWVILDLEGVSVQEVSWSGDGKWTWREWVMSKGFSMMQFYVTNSNFYNKEWYFDSFMAVTDLDKFIADLKAEELRPMAPDANPTSGEVPANTQIGLTASEGTYIYYTLDGTEPALDGDGNPTGTTVKYEMYSMGNGQEDASPISITDTENETVLKAISVSTATGAVSGVSTFVYSVEPEYDGPNSIVINNGSGEGNHTFKWYDPNTFEASVVENDSDNGAGLSLKADTADRIVKEISYEVDTTGIEQIHNFTAISYHVSFKCPNETDKMYFSPRISGTSTYLYGKAYAIGDDGTVMKFSNESFQASEFSGTVIIIINQTDSVGMSYGAKKMNWFDFIKAKGLTSFGFYYTRNAMESDYNTEFVIDDITIHYDVNKYLEEIGLEDLLADYGVGTYENTNMLVANDGSGKKINSGISAISDNLTVEQSDYSIDERCLKLTFGAGDANITLPDYCEDETAMIGDGVTFWIENLKGNGAVPLELTLRDSDNGAIEIFEYSDKRWYYLIDKDGVIERCEGKLIIPDGFRGWVIIPGDNLYYTENGSTFVNGEPDYDKAMDIDVKFINGGNLTGKSLYLDDISYYLSFEALVKSRAVKWHENTVLLSTDSSSGDTTSPKTGDESSPVIAVILLSVSALSVLVLRRRKV